MTAYRESDILGGDEVTPDLFREEPFKQHAGDLTVVINSPGGDVCGLGTHNVRL